MKFASVYMDESCSHAGASMLCVAGFLFEDDRAALLNAEWRAVLTREKMPYMRMSQFTKDGQAPYQHLSRTRRIAIQTELVQIIRAYRSLAFICGIDEKMFHRVLGEYKTSSNGAAPCFTAYTWCLVDCQKLVVNWALNHCFDGEIAYFFEAGHRDQSEANTAFNLIFRDEIARRRLRYRNHSFIGKQDVGALQAADMLAWLGGSWFRRGRPGTQQKMRRDLQEILTTDPFDPNSRISIHWWTEPRLREALDRVQSRLRAADWDMNMALRLLRLEQPL